MNPRIFLQVCKRKCLIRQTTKASGSDLYKCWPYNEEMQTDRVKYICYVCMEA